MNMTCKWAKVGVGRKMSLVIASIDVRVTTNWFLQSGSGKDIVPISWFHEKLNGHLQSISQAAREPKNLRDITRCAVVIQVYFAQPLQNLKFWDQDPFCLVEEEMPVVSHYNRYQ